MGEEGPAAETPRDSCCAEKIQDEEGVFPLEDYKGVPCPTLLVYMDGERETPVVPGVYRIPCVGSTVPYSHVFVVSSGQMKQKITGANAPKLMKIVIEVRGHLRRVRRTN